MSEAEKIAFVMGMKYASVLVADHWNDSYMKVLQKDQAQRSAAAIARAAKMIEEIPLEKFAEEMEKKTR